ncbi:hypothetical protein [Thermogemmatispora sp.]|uniref:hypothetical protein n=1 Tax=Thermogemmatispora sp. TaxID=1968838 RepID=UPI0035E44AC2
MINEEEQKEKFPAADPHGQREGKEEAAEKEAAENGHLQKPQGAGRGEETLQRTAGQQSEAEAEGSGDRSQVSQARQPRQPGAKAPRGPHASLWPFVLALAIALACLGVVTHPAVLVGGAVLIVVAVVGWGLERY